MHAHGDTVCCNEQEGYRNEPGCVNVDFLFDGGEETSG